MKFSNISRLLIFYFLSLFSLTCAAWNALGHMVVADIAYQQLNPVARNKVDYLVTQFNKEYPTMNSFLDLAYWPDILRVQDIQAFAHWHYIDNPLTLDGTPIKNVIDTDNAVWAVNQVERIVKNNQANPYERVRFLSFFIHIVADLHQPLHTVSLFSEKHLEGDKGGNLYKVRYKGQSINLHQLWDKGLGVFEGEHSKEHADQIAKALIIKYPSSFFNEKINELNADSWAQEGTEYAKQYVYEVPEDEVVTPVYEEKAKQLVEQQAALGGYRLAILLNQLLE